LISEILKTNIIRLQKKPIIFAAGIRTAGTTLKYQMEYAFNAEVVSCKSGSGFGHNILRPDCLPPVKSLARDIVYRKRKILHQHFMPTSYNRSVIQNNFNVPKQIKVIVSLRNIFDVMVSASDNVRKGGGQPFLYIEKNKNKTEEDLNVLNNVMIQAGIYCINFYMSWYLANKTSLYNVMFIDFDDIVNRPINNIKNISHYLELDFNKGFKSEIEHTKANINKGVKGRGVAVPIEVQDIISKFSLAYKDIDFSKIGLK